MAILLKQTPPVEGADLMGLQNIGLNVFPGVKSAFQIPMINGKYNIGLDGNTKEVKELKKKFETHFGVVFDSPEGQEWLGSYEINIDHDVTAYDPQNVEDLFDLHLLRVNNGMGIVASSQEEIDNAAVNTFKFKLTDEYAEVEERVDKKLTRNAAIRKLEELYDTNSDKLLLLAKYLFDIGTGVSSNKKTAYDKIDDYINQSTANAQDFLKASNLEQKYLSVVTKVKEAIYRQIIRFHQGQYILYATQAPLGRTEEEVINYCLNPTNIDVVGYGMDDDLPTSISAQLNKYIN